MVDSKRTLLPTPSVWPLNIAHALTHTYLEHAGIRGSLLPGRRGQAGAEYVIKGSLVFPETWRNRLHDLRTAVRGQCLQGRCVEPYKLHAFTLCMFNAKQRDSSEYCSHFNYAYT